MADQAPIPSSPVIPPLLTAAQVAALLQVSLRTLRRHIKSGALPVVRIGRLVRVRREVVKAMLSRGDGW